MGTDVLYVETVEGSKTAVIDVTNPAFSVTATDAELAAMADQYVREAAQWREVPEPLKQALRSSMLGRGLMAASGGFLDAMTTYLLKLGPEHLGAEASAIDRRIAASFPAFTARLRLQDMAQLLADGLEQAIATQPDRRVCLVNIAGGVAADSWNALIRLNTPTATEGSAREPQALTGRHILIAVLDLDANAAAFGARAVAVLGTLGAPLDALHIEFRHALYDWSKTNRLANTLQELDVRDAACAISSEGGLFEYGSDEEIISNLQSIHAGTAPDAFVVGSVTRDGEPVRASLLSSQIRTWPRTLEAFRTLCAASGWRLEEVLERPFSYHVRMVKT